MNPTLPPPPKEPKKKLKQFFKDLKADRKIMVAELKLACAKRH